MTSITLKQLEIFVAVANKLSFSSAANSLHLTQPAISKQIRNLEEQCGYTLFEQVGKKIYLTETGQHLLKYTENILGAVELLNDNINQSDHIIGGKLRIGMGDTLQHVMFDILADFRNLYPKVEFNVSINNYPVLSEQLLENKLDFAIMGNVGTRFGLTAELITRPPLLLVASAKHPIAIKRKITFKELQNETFIIGEHGSASYILTNELFNKIQPIDEKIFQISNFEAMKHAVKANLGVAILAKFILSSELTKGSIASLNVVGLDPMKLDLYWVQHKDKQLSKAGKLFKKMVFKQLKLLEH